MSVDLEFLGDTLFRVARITLNRPERTNALVPELVTELNEHLDTAAHAGVGALELQGEGKFFSSGGDVAGFHAVYDDRIQAYADSVVGALQQAVLKLLRFPAPVLARVQGGVTGGAAGLVFAADLVAMSKHAFIQPYYNEVGFAPDGGWCALLAEKISPSTALSVQILNQPVKAKQAKQLGLVQAVVDEDELDGVIDGWLQTLSEKSVATNAATRRLIWDEQRISRIAARLGAERQAFLELIAKPETRAGMARFLGSRDKVMS